MKTSLKNNKVINDTIDMKTVMIKDSLIIVFAFLSLLGKTIATGYVKAAIGIIILVSAVKVSKTPNASGPYNLVFIGDINKDKVCAPTVHDATINIFRKKFFLKSFLFCININITVIC